MPGFTILDSGLATYNIVILTFTPAATATDVLQLGGFGGSTKVRWVSVSGTTTTARQQPVGLLRRSAVNTGGTSTLQTPQKADSTDGASQNTVRLWTVNPAGLGTLVGMVDGGTFAVTTGSAIQDRAIFQYEFQTSKPIVLNGGNDLLSINFQVGTAPIATVAADKFDMDIWWTER